MTSTNINIGMDNETRNSSKVLKPPGGGHSDIFGIHDNKEPAKARAYQKSAISEIFGAPPSSPEKYLTDSKQPKEEEMVKEKIEVDQKPTPPRARIPPGGFSSGLW